MLVIEDSNASALWARAWETITKDGRKRTHARGDYFESLHSVLALQNPRNRWVLSRHPSINPAFALAEVIWIIRGRNDSEFLTSWNRALPSFAGSGDTFDGAYGARLRSRFGFDQLERAASTLSSNPEQRQVVLQIWDPSTDFPTADGHSRSPDIPCNVSSMLKVVDGRLEWLQVMRSNDVVRGLPYNLVQWTTVQEILAGWMSLDVGAYVHISDSLHIYEKDLVEFERRDSSEPAEAPDLRLSKTDSDKVFLELELAAESLSATREVSVAIEWAERVSSPVYADWTRVLAAERIRRLGEQEIGLHIVGQIVDHDLQAVAYAWHTQRPSRKASA